MTDERGQVVTLSNRDWLKILAWIFGSLGILVASWTSVQLSVARLEAQVEAMGLRIELLEDTVKAHAWSSR